MSMSEQRMKRVGTASNLTEHRLTYFPMEGVAEPIRLLFKYGNIPFEDDRIEFKDWQKLKLKYPFGKLPILTYHGKVYMQHVAICKYIAGLVDLLGSNGLENMEIDGIVETISDFRIGLMVWFYEQDTSIKEFKRDELFDVFIPFYLERFEKIVKDNMGYYACKKLTWADIYAVGILDLLNFYYGGDIIAKYPILKAHEQKIWSMPELKMWHKERPKTNYRALNEAISEARSGNRD